MNEILDGIDSDISSVDGKSSVSNKMVVDERILFGIDNLVNKVKIKTKEVIEDGSDKGNYNNELDNDTVSVMKHEKASLSPLMPPQTSRQHTKPQVQDKYPEFPDSYDDKYSQSEMPSKQVINNFDSRPKAFPGPSGPTGPTGPVGPTSNTNNNFDRLLPPESPPLSVRHSHKPKHSPANSRRSSKDSRRSRKSKHSVSSSTKRERIFEEKVELLTEWEEITKYVKRSEYKKLDMDSHIEDIRYELKRLKNIRKRQNFVKKSHAFVVGAGKVIEFLCDQVTFIDIEMNGFSNSLKHDDGADEYYLELYERYKGAGKSYPPEIKLLFWFLSSALMFALTNKAPALLSKFLNKGNKSGGGNSKNKKSKVNRGGYTEMSPPDINDEELAELLYDNEKLR
jgi:hypothetical protein